MTVVTEVNWQAKYLEQIDARLTGLQHGQVDLNAKVDRVRDELRGEIRGVRDQLDAKINGVRDELQGETRGFRDELRHEIREVRNLVLGMFAFVVTAVIGTVLRTIL